MTAIVSKTMSSVFLSYLRWILRKESNNKIYLTIDLKTHVERNVSVKLYKP